MEEANRGALMLVWFVAGAFMLMGAVELTLDWAQYEMPRLHAANGANTATHTTNGAESKPSHKAMKAASILFWGVTFLIGIAMLARSKALAEWISDQLE